MIPRNRLSWMVLFLVLFSACGPDTIFLRPTLDSPEVHVKNGNDLLARGKIDAAYNEFVRAEHLDQAYAPAHVGIALIQGHRGDVDGGFETLAKARKMAVTPEEIKLVDQGYEQLKRIGLNHNSQRKVD